MSDQTTEPIHGCVERWHAHLRGELHGGLDAILHPDCVFLSPIVFTPQQGREITKLYLQAAGATLSGEHEFLSSEPGKPAVGGAFRYVKQIARGHQAMLEFETTVEGKYVNGVDILTCDDNGMITEFKVMIRPLQAINLLHAQMKAMLEQMNSI